MLSPSPLRISVVIPAYNEERYIWPCLESILMFANPDLLEIIVVDNASTDRTAELAEKFPGVRVVYEPRKGTSFARQRGLEEATGDYIAFIDADSMIPAHWFTIVRHVFTSDPGLVCLSGPYIYHDLSGWEKSFVAMWSPLHQLTYKYTKSFIIGGNFIAKRNVLKEMGGFDTSITFYGDDTNIARRICEFGKVLFLPEFYVLSSGRRIACLGAVKSGSLYALNFFSEFFFHKPATVKDYVSVR
ncbi:MAG: glycosyltransferase family 2 protein [Candidatus Peribacteraceae bacterium]|nr:glycosyltransferase family 2 protein [Candidatus Peribacteraceae bacterium]